MDQPDQLRELFRMQKALNERIGVSTDEFNDEQKTEWVLNYCRAMSQELAELTDSVPWKWWAKYQEFDKQNAKVEIVDLLNLYKSKKQLSADIIGRGGAWLDTGSIEDFYKTSAFVSAIENRQGFKIACLEEISYCPSLQCASFAGLRPSYETPMSD